MENLRERLIEETRKQLFESGYESLNIRAIAESCHIAVGTVYNYFPSKEVLAANVVLEGWQQVSERMRQSAENCTEIEEGISSVYGLLLDFHNLYRKIFSESPMMPAGSAFRDRHLMLCGQISELISLVIGRFHKIPDSFLCTFIAESFLAASNEEWSYERIAPIIMKLIN